MHQPLYEAIVIRAATNTVRELPRLRIGFSITLFISGALRTSSIEIFFFAGAAHMQPSWSCMALLTLVILACLVCRQRPRRLLSRAELRTSMPLRLRQTCNEHRSCTPGARGSCAIETLSYSYAGLLIVAMNWISGC